MAATSCTNEVLSTFLLLTFIALLELNTVLKAQAFSSQKNHKIDYVTQKALNKS